MILTFFHSSPYLVRTHKIQKRLEHEHNTSSKTSALASWYQLYGVLEQTQVAYLTAMCQELPFAVNIVLRTQKY